MVTIGKGQIQSEISRDIIYLTNNLDKCFGNLTNISAVHNTRISYYIVYCPYTYIKLYYPVTSKHNIISASTQIPMSNMCTRTISFISTKGINACLMNIIILWI